MALHFSSVVPQGCSPLPGRKHQCKDRQQSVLLLSDGLPFLHSVRSLMACYQNRVHLSQWENKAVLYKAARAVNLTGSQMHFFSHLSPPYPRATHQSTHRSWFRPAYHILLSNQLPSMHTGSVGARCWPASLSHTAPPLLLVFAKTERRASPAIGSGENSNEIP